MRSSLNKFARLALVPALLATALSAQAAPANDAYAGVALGAGELDIDCGGSTSCDSGDTGFKVYVGFDIPRSPLPRLAFEAAYIDFGAATAHYTSLAQYKVEASAVAFDLALRGNLAPSVSVVGRLGLAYVSAKGTSTGSVPFVTISSSSSSSGLEPHLGLGLELALNKQFKLTGSADFTSYDTGKASGSARLLSVGLQAGF
jgi:OOP family OmpA-OmpF porin